MTVHNRGTEDGPGLACREVRLPGGGFKGFCLLTPQERMSALIEKQADMKQAMEHHVSATNTILSEFRSLSREFNQATKDVLAAAATLVNQTELGDVDIPVVIGGRYENLVGHAGLFKFGDGSAELRIKLLPNTLTQFEKFLELWELVEISFQAKPGYPQAKNTPE